MSTMGKYCKAYLLKNLREFSQWNEYAEEIKREKNLVDEKEVEIERNLTEDDIIYIQENTEPYIKPSKQLLSFFKMEKSKLEN
jgi:hypothetical protein